MFGILDFVAATQGTLLDLMVTGACIHRSHRIVTNADSSELATTPRVHCRYRLNYSLNLPMKEAC